jgi:N-acetylated-alpha-linked acidic dipeptidase
VVKLRAMIRFALIAVALSSSLVTASSRGQGAQGSTPGQTLTSCEAKLLELPKPEQFRAHLERLTREPHVAGSPESFRVVEYLEAAMRAAGLKVERFEYDVYLPHPVRSEVALVTPTRMPLNNQENILPDDRFSADPRLGPGWNAFSGSGDVTGQVVFAHQGRKEDFDALAKMGVNVKGKVVIARYGGNFRG